MTNWYDTYQDDYLGSDTEHKAFLSWFHETHGTTYHDDESETDLLNEFRDTGWWTDAFLDWATQQKEAGK